MKKSFLTIAIIGFLLTLIFTVSPEKITTSTPAFETPVNAATKNSLSLALPINCKLGKGCYIIHYLDHDPSSAAKDFACGGLTYDGHNGTDFAIPDERAMAAGVAVKAAAAGKVLRVRDGVPDRRVEDQTDKSKVQSIECGNGVVIDHGNGFSTQYCHLRCSEKLTQTWLNLINRAWCFLPVLTKVDGYFLSTGVNSGQADLTTLSGAFSRFIAAFSSRSWT